MSELLFPVLEGLSKLLIYLGGAAIIGGYFTLFLAKAQPALIRFIRRYIVAGVLLALCALVMHFFAQVGNFAAAGWSGMADPVYVAVLWDSPLGQSVWLRAAALGGTSCALLLAWLRARGYLTFISDGCHHALLAGLFALSAVLWAITFSLSGHTTELSLIARFLLSVHVFIALLWMGSLLPLWWACRCVAVQPLQQLMQRFGELAMGLVLVLLACGAVLAYQLLGSFSALTATAYGQVLLLKVLLVALLIGFAAWHRWRLVPQLTQQAGVNRLRHSIRLEALAGLGVLVVTVLLTTVVGPAMAE